MKSPNFSKDTNPKIISEMEGEGTKAPPRPEYVNLSEYPPVTDIESELHYDGCRVVSKVPRWAHEKWLLKNQNAAVLKKDHLDDNKSGLQRDGCRTVAKEPIWAHEKWFLKHLNAADQEIDHSASAAAAAASSGRKHVRVVYPCFASADAAPSGTKKRPCVEIPPETVAAYAELIDWNPRYAKVYPDVYSYHRHPDRYGFYLEKGHVVRRVKKWAGPIITPKVGGRFFPLKDELPSAVENQVPPSPTAN